MGHLWRPPVTLGFAKPVELVRLGHLWWISIAGGLASLRRRLCRSPKMPSGGRSPSLCSIPWQGDFPRGKVPTGKGALSVHWKLDDRPISMKLYEFAAIDGPEKTSATEMHQRIIAMATEQGPRIPA